MVPDAFLFLKEEYLKTFALSFFDREKYNKDREELKTKIFQYLLFKPFQLDDQCLCIINLSEKEYTYYHISQSDIRKSTTNYGMDAILSAVLLKEIRFMSKTDFMEIMDGRVRDLKQPILEYKGAEE
jgi:hypothetical protein